MKKIGVLFFVYALEIISSGEVFSDDFKYMQSSFKEDFELYAHTIQHPHRVERLDAQRLSNFLYTAEKQWDDTLGIILKNFLGPILSVCIDARGRYITRLCIEDTQEFYAWDNHIMRVINDQLCHVKKLLHDYLYEDLVDKYKHRRMQKSVYYVGYDGDDLVKEIDYGQKIGNYCQEKRDNKLRFLENQLKYYQNGLINITRKIEQNIENYNKSWYGRDVYLQENEALKIDKKTISKKIKQLSVEKESIDIKGYIVTLDNEPWADLYCNNSFYERIYYFDDIHVVHSIHEDDEFPTVHYFACPADIKNSYIGDETQKIEKVFLRRGSCFRFQDYEVRNGQKRGKQLSAELYYKGDFIFSCVYDSKTNLVIISPNGSQVANIDLQKKIIRVYKLAQKKRVMSLFEYKNYCKDLSLLQLYTQYKELALQE